MNKDVKIWIVTFGVTAVIAFSVLFINAIQGHQDAENDGVFRGVKQPRKQMRNLANAAKLYTEKSSAPTLNRVYTVDELVDAFNQDPNSARRAIDGRDITIEGTYTGFVPMNGDQGDLCVVLGSVDSSKVFEKNIRVAYPQAFNSRLSGMMGMQRAQITGRFIDRGMWIDFRGSQISLLNKF